MDRETGGRKRRRYENQGGKLKRRETSWPHSESSFPRSLQDFPCLCSLWKEGAADIDYPLGKREEDPAARLCSCRAAVGVGPMCLKTEVADHDL